MSVPRSASRYRRPNTAVHRVDLPDTDVTVLGDESLTTPARTVVDLARRLPLADAVALADSSLRLELVRVRDIPLLAGWVRGRGAATACRALSLADPRSGSMLESLCRVLLVGAGLAPPASQYEVRRGGMLLARVDFAWPASRVAVEVDGFAFHADRDVYRRDRRRLNELELAGWTVLRFSWEDVVGQPEYVLRSIGRALAAAAA